MNMIISEWPEPDINVLDEGPDDETLEYLRGVLDEGCDHSSYLNQIGDILDSFDAQNGGW